MTRRSPRALTRRLALALSLMLLAGALAVPAFASSHTTGNSEPGISAPVEGDTYYFADTLELHASEPSANTVQWALRLEDPDPDSEGTFAGNVDGFSDVAVFEEGEFSFDIDLSDPRFSDLPSSDEYYFVFNPNPGGRYEVQFTLLDEALEGFEVVQCDGGDCEITQAGFTASTEARGKDGRSAFLGLRLAGVDDPVAEAVSDLCEAEVAKVNRPARLGEDLVQLLPINFEPGSIIVQSTIPGSFVDQGPRTARGAGIFQVCVAAEADQYGGYGSPSDPLPEIDGTDFFGPIILDRCDEYSTDDDACVLDKTKNRGDVVLTYQLPTEDPWLK